MNLIDHSKINVAYCVVYKETMEEGPIELLMYISQKIEHGIETACKIGNADISKALWPTFVER